MLKKDADIRRRQASNCGIIRSSVLAFTLHPFTVKPFPHLILLYTVELVQLCPESFKLPIL